MRKVLSEKGEGQSINSQSKTLTIRPLETHQENSTASMPMHVIRATDRQKERETREVSDKCY